MKKIVLSIVFAVSAYSINVKAQVGINIASPSSTLDITAKNATGTSKSVDGLLVPRVDRERAQNMNGVPTSTLIFVNSIATGTQTGTAVNIDAVGHYSFNGTVWVKLGTGTGSSVNIYNSDGSLTGNRVVTQGANTLAFNGTAANAFSVDGTTLSVDAANDRVGVGTTAPENKFHVVTTTAVSNRYSLIDAPVSTNSLPILALRNTSPAATGNYSLLGFSNTGPTGGGATWGIGSVRTAASQEDFFFGNSLGSNYLERLRITSAGFVGIGTATPLKPLHVNGGLQITNELNVGGDGITAGSAGTIGQILTSSGPGAAPAWQAPTPNLNIYNSDGTLSGNRIVTQGANTLAFTGTSANAFSVDGSTLSVNAANDRVGIGTTTPTSKLDLGPTAGSTVTDVAGKKLAVYNDATGADFYGLGISSGVLQFHAASTSAEAPGMVLTGGGNVGIGTSAPENRFQVVSTASVNNRFTLVDAPESTNQFPIMALRNTSPVATGNYALLGFSNAGPTSGGANWGIGSVRTATAEDFFLGSTNDGGAYTERLRVTTGGYVGVGTNAPTSLLSVNGSADKIGGGSWGTFSDSRMKKNVQPYVKGLPEILKINTVTFQYNGKGGYPDDGKTYTGVIAQEIEKVLPGTVTKIKSNDFDDQRKYDSSEITYTLINAIKEQQKIINEQGKQIKELQADMQAVKAKK